MSEYHYLNLNPLGKDEQDCVCRAISLATGRDYYDIEDKLHLTARLFECDELCVCCYKHLLDYVFEYPKVYCRDMTVSEFMHKHPRGTFILRMDGHCTCIINGRLFDTQDCLNGRLTDAWSVEN